MRPSLMIDRKAREIKLVGIDVDGVLTDGGIYLGDSAGSRVELKRYHIEDGLGIHFLKQAGLRVAVITGRVSESVRLRCSELEIDDVEQDAKARKLPALLRVMERYNVRMHEVAFIGDDFPDLAILRVVGLSVAVGNAVPEVKRAAKMQLERNGGHGAVREFAEVLLKARGQWEQVTERYIEERSVPIPEPVA
jgi:3-deoxy-D-manno-octulosonate 8-phosphate phosphatase (KDO 8-P phosphatase)